MFQKGKISAPSTNFQSTTTRKLCAKPGCTNEVFVEPRTGIEHDFCGRTHAKEALGHIPPPHGDCHRCNLPGCDLPVAFDEATGRVHDFCSKSHHEDAVRLKVWPPAQMNNCNAPFARCAYAGCKKVCYFDAVNNRLHAFCGRSHAIAYNQLQTPNCVICLEDIKSDATDILKTRCGHKFHLKCINDWKQKSDACPVCRKKM